MDFAAPSAPSVFPELVKIGGGTFTMGARAGTEADERPAHPVKLSTFYIGRYEVTNAELEHFMPEHRQWRDGYSQRAKDREFNSPVYPGYIYLGFRISLPEAGWRKLNVTD